MSAENPAAVVRFLHAIETLKTTKRTGWVNHGVPGPESIGDHMHRMAVMAMLVPDSVDGAALDRSRCVRMAAVHDLAEAVVGDITPDDPRFNPAQKHALEARAMEDLVAPLASPQAREILELWREYEAGATPEARLVKDLDKFEMISQAFEYERRAPRTGGPRRLDAFFASTSGRFTTSLVQSWAAALYQERANFFSSGPSSPPVEKPVQKHSNRRNERAI